MQTTWNFQTQEEMTDVLKGKGHLNYAPEILHSPRNITIPKEEKEWDKKAKDINQNMFSELKEA